MTGLAQSRSNSAGKAVAGTTALPVVPTTSSRLVTGLSTLIVAFLILMVFASATGLTPYTYALLAIGASITSLALISLMRIRLTSTIISWLLFAVIAGIAALRSGDIPFTMLATIVLGILLTANFGWEGSLTKSIAFISVPFAVVTIAMYLSDGVTAQVISSLPLSDAIPGDYRSGATTHYTLNGILLSLGTLCLAPYAFTRSPRRAIWITLLVIVAFALVLTTKRAHIAFAVLSLLLTYVMIGAAGNKRVRRLFNAAAISAASFACAIPLATYIPAMSRVVDRFIQATGDESFNGRRAFYDVALSLWTDAPIVGQGWGTFTPAFNRTGAGLVFINQGFESINAHNVYLQLLAETGIVGLAAFLIAAITTLVCGVRLIRSSDQGYMSPRIQPLVASSALQFFFLLYCLTGNPLYDLTFFVPYFISCSIIWSYQVMEQRSTRILNARSHID